MKSVAVYLPQNEPCCPVRGGALATWTRKVYGRLVDRWDIAVFAPDFGEVEYCFRQQTIKSSPLAEPCYRFIRNREGKGLLNPIKKWFRNSYARRAAVAVATVKPDVIHIHNDPEAVIPFRQHNSDATIVLHMNNDHLIEGEGSQTAVAVVQAADRVVFCSHYVMAGALAKVKGLRCDRCLVIHNGADLPAEPVWPTGKYKSENGPVILFVGRIVEQKGLHILLAAMPQVLAQFPTATLRIVGGVRFGSSEVDSYLARLRIQAGALGDRVLFVGPVPHTEIAKYFQAADTFVCPSVWNDPFPLVNLEAMGSGVPVVAFARGGIPEAVGDAGLLVQETEPGPLAAALIRILRDHGLRRELAGKSWDQVASHFTWDIIAQQWQEQLEDWLKA